MKNLRRLKEARKREERLEDFRRRAQEREASETNTTEMLLKIREKALQENSKKVDERSQSSSSRQSSPSKKRPRFWESPSQTTTLKDAKKWLNKHDNEAVNRHTSPFTLSTRKIEGDKRGDLSRLLLDSDDDDEESESGKRVRSDVGTTLWQTNNSKDTPHKNNVSKHIAFDDDSDSDDSFGASLLQKFQQRQQQGKSASSSAKEDSCSQAQTTLKQRGGLSHTTSNAETWNDDSLQRQDIELHSSTVPAKRSCESLDSQGEEPLDDEEEELMAVAKKLASPPHDNKRIANNPIALEKLEAERFKTALTLKNPRVSNKDDDDSLWSDSEADPDASDEEYDLQNERKKRASKSNHGSEPLHTSHTSTKKRRTTANLEFWEENNVLESQGDLLRDRSMEELEKDLHPYFSKPNFGPKDEGPLKLEHGDESHEVSFALSRYLASFQEEGIKFMYNCLMENMGCILGDDMGLGKTVQVMGLLSALYRKKGNGLDVFRIEQRKKMVEIRMQELRGAQQEALLHGTISADGLHAASGDSLARDFDLPPRWWPVMIVVPSSVLCNWQQELAKFTHFSVATYDKPNSREKALSQITSGMAELLLTTHPKFEDKTCFDDFLQIQGIKWKLVIIDEFHKFKNIKSKRCMNLRKMKKQHQNLVLGMTGTLMQNKHEELWNLIDQVETGFLGTWKEFDMKVSKPMKLARAKTASSYIVSRSEKIGEALQALLKKIFLQRKKEVVLRDYLTDKNEKVVMCELTPLQRSIYKQILLLPEVDHVRKAKSPCDCGVNMAFFQRLHNRKSKREQLSFYRDHKSEIITRFECCYNIPKDDNGNLHPDAVIWRTVRGHGNEGSEGCRHCPYCCGFALMSKLYKLGNHVSLIQASKTANADLVGSAEYIKFQKELAFSKVALHAVADQLSGKYVRNDTILDDHFALSGKIRVLHKLLDTFARESARVLIFSQSVETLDLIQHYLKFRGHEFLRMDGSTASTLRQDLVDQFNHDDKIFIFLLSTRAMGVGLNLTSANKVIMFDTEWNPANDEQAQDRAYRIGQRRDVDVYRLIAEGTVDELKYLRQLYKVQLKQDTLGDPDGAKPRAARIFRGVDGDKDRKGELFGYVNLFRFKNGSFLDDIWKSTNEEAETHRSGGVQIHTLGDLQDKLAGIGSRKLDEVYQDDSVDEIDLMADAISNGESNDEPRDNVADTKSGNNVRKEAALIKQRETNRDVLDGHAFNHADLLREDKGRAAVEEGDEGFDEEAGGETQAIFEIYEGGVAMSDNPQDGTYEIEDDVQTTGPSQESMPHRHAQNYEQEFTLPDFLRAPAHRGTGSDAIAPANGEDGEACLDRDSPDDVAEKANIEKKKHRNSQGVLGPTPQQSGSFHLLEPEWAEDLELSEDEIVDFPASYATDEIHRPVPANDAKMQGPNETADSEKGGDCDADNTLKAPVPCNDKGRDGSMKEPPSGRKSAAKTKFNLLGTASSKKEDDKETTFSASDLFLPSYSKKSSKKKKKHAN